MPTESQEESISSLKLTVGRRHDIRARPQLNAVFYGRQSHERNGHVPTPLHR
jgi:hypothetical protein